MTNLPKADKIQLIDSRAKGLEYKKYALGLDLIVENSRVAPDANAISVIENAIQEINSQLEALNTELDIVNSLPE